MPQGAVLIEGPTLLRAPFRATRDPLAYAGGMREVVSVVPGAMVKSSAWFSTKKEVQTALSRARSQELIDDEGLHMLTEALETCDIPTELSEVFDRVAALASPSVDLGVYSFRTCDCGADPIVGRHGHLYIEGVRQEETRSASQEELLGELAFFVGEERMSVAQAATIFAQAREALSVYTSLSSLMDSLPREVGDVLEAAARLPAGGSAADLERLLRERLGDNAGVRVLSVGSSGDAPEPRPSKGLWGWFMGLFN